MTSVRKPHLLLIIKPRLRGKVKKSINKRSGSRKPWITISRARLQPKLTSEVSPAPVKKIALVPRHKRPQQKEKTWRSTNRRLIKKNRKPVVDQEMRRGNRACGTIPRHSLADASNTIVLLPSGTTSQVTQYSVEGEQGGGEKKNSRVDRTIGNRRYGSSFSS